MVEVLIASTLIGMLSVGVLGAVGKLKSVALDSGLRRQGLYALNGEMARLAALYRHTAFGELAETSGGFPTASGGLSGLPTSRLVYPAHLQNGLSQSPLVTDDFSEFDVGTELILSHVSTTDGGARRNAIMIDPERQLTASLSWTAETVSTNCHLSTPCRRLTVYLDYPYQSDGSSANALSPSSMARRTLSLMTVVGRLPGNTT